MKKIFTQLLAVVSLLLVGVVANAATVETPTLPSLPTGVLDVKNLSTLDANGWAVYNASAISGNWYVKKDAGTATWTPTAAVNIASPFTSVTANTGTSVVTLRANRTVAYRVKNASKVSLVYACYSAHKVTLDAREITNGTIASTSITDSKTESKDANKTAILTLDLDGNKEYVIYAYSNNDGGNTYFYQIAFKTADNRTATAAPSISYASTASESTVTITNNETTAAGDIYYTTDGTDPSASSTKYSSPFSVTSSCTIKAIFVPSDATAYKNSSVVSKSIVVLEIQPYTATTNYAAPSDAPAAGSIIVSKNLEVKTVYATNISDVASNYQSVQGRTYQKAMQIRINGIDASGVYTEKEGSTPLVITPAKNGTLQVIYRRQSDDAKTNTFTNGSGKDIHLSKSGTNAKLTSEVMAVFDTFDSNTDPSKDPAWYGHFAKQWTVEAGQEYLLWASGTTIQMAGLRFFPDHTVDTFTPGDENYSTMCLDYDAIIPEGVEAYTGTLSGNSLSLTQITGVIPAKTPVVLKGNSSVTFKKNLEVKDPISNNSLEGCIASKETSSVSGGTVCVLGYENEKVGFYKYEGTLAANKAYLVVPTNAAKGLSIEIGGETTGIKNVSAVAKSGVMYNLAGQRVNADAKGMVIINGKVVIKK